MSTDLDAVFDALDDPQVWSQHEEKQEALDRFKAVFGPDATLLDACLDLRMACNGAGDPISGDERDRRMSAIEGRLRTWTPRGEPWLGFDEAVRKLVQATLVEVGT